MKKKQKLTRCGLNGHLWKIFKVMRIAFVLLFMTVFELVASDINAQIDKVTINQKNATIKDVLENIESLSNYKFFYNEGLIDVKRMVTIEVSNKQVQSVLDEIFKGTDVTFRIVESNIILTNTLATKAKVEAVQQETITIKGVVSDATG